MKGADELGDEIGPHQVLLQRLENEVLEDLAADAAPVVAEPVTVRLGAAEIIAAHCRQRMAALAADDKAGEDVPGPAFLPEPALPYCDRRWRLRDRVEPRSRPLPKLLFDDAKLGNRFDHPLVAGVAARLPLAGRGILYETLAVPDHPPDIKLIAQNACSPLGMAPDRRILPWSAAGARNPFRIQPLGDRARRRAAGERRCAERHWLLRE
jgi:hypothetical protein